MEVVFRVISRGTMLVEYGEKSLMIPGELTFEPPVFYAEMNSIKYWEPPFENESVSENEKNEIIDFIKENQGGTLIMFE